MPTYNKLVRDGIPQIIADTGATAELRRLSAAERVDALRVKLNEEIAEYDAAESDEARVEELADALEVLLALAAAAGASPADLEELRADKAAARGAFDEGWFLVSTSD